MEQSRKRPLMQTSLAAFTSKGETKRQKVVHPEDAQTSSDSEAPTFFNHGAFLHGIYPNSKFLKSVSKPTKIASFDMDWTLIRTKGGQTFPKNKDDWELLYDELTQKKLASLDKDGFQIVVFTNQAGVATGRTKVADLNHKFSAIQQKVGVPMIFLASTAKDSVFRKP